MAASWGRALRAAGVYVSVVLGAGFASGQEMTRFFTRYGVSGFWGLGLAGVLLAVGGWAVLDICAREDIRGYGAFLEAALGKRAGAAMDAAVMAFIAVLYCAMLSGVGALAKEGFGLPFTGGVVALSLVCFCVFLTGLEGIVAINAFLAPIMVVGGATLGLYGIFGAAPAFAAAGLGGGWRVSAVIFASYNLMTAVPILCGMGDMVGGRKTARRAGLLGGACIAFLGLCLAAPLYLRAGRLAGVDLPMLALVRGFGVDALRWLYVFVLCAAVLTTAVSNGFAIIQWLERKWRVNKTLAAALVTVFGGALGHVGLSALVGRAYPAFGYIGLFEMALVAVYWLFGGRKK